MALGRFFCAWIGGRRTTEGLRRSGRVAVVAFAVGVAAGRALLANDTRVGGSAKAGRTAAATSPRARLAPARKPAPSGSEGCAAEVCAERSERGSSSRSTLLTPPPTPLSPWGRGLGV